MSKSNFVFFGTPVLAVYVLEELKKASLLPTLIVTMPDAKAGRGMKLDSPPVKKWADTHGIPTLQPEKLDDMFVENLKKRKSDVFVLAAYGKMLPKKLLEVPTLGILNIHPSMLPRLRGPSPVRSAILTGEQNTGTSIILLDEEMDHGPIVAQEEINISDEDWPPVAPDLEERLFRLGGKLLVNTMDSYISGKIKPSPQDESSATYCKKIKKEDGLVELEKEPAEELYKKYCAYYGWPGIYFMKDGKRIKITSAKLEDNEFLIERVIPEGRREISFAEFSSQTS